MRSWRLHSVLLLVLLGGATIGLSLNATGISQSADHKPLLPDDVHSSYDTTVTHVDVAFHSLPPRRQRDVDGQQIYTDYHDYYNSTVVVNNEEVYQAYWEDMTNITDVHTDTLLSNSHRRAKTVQLSFDFPFYGNLVRNVTIGTGGFIYTGDYLHSWLAATQYIAPLMASFDTSLSTDSYVKYVDNGTALTVQWERVKIHDNPELGEFTFQAILLNTGDIVFVYQSVPVAIDSINDDHHPVKVGLSDAYIIDRVIFFTRRKTLYEYHRIRLDRLAIRNWTVIYLKALLTCQDATDCQSCLSKITNFSCKWCPQIGRCSNEFDRNRQAWLSNNCVANNTDSVMQCPNTHSPDDFTLIP